MIEFNGAYGGCFEDDGRLRLGVCDSINLQTAQEHIRYKNCNHIIFSYRPDRCDQHTTALQTPRLSITVTVPGPLIWKEVFQPCTAEPHSKFPTFGVR